MNLFYYIEKLFSKNSLQEFIDCSYDNLYQYHFSLGIWIRNNLLKEGALVTIFETGGAYQKDDMAALILQLFYIHIRTKSVAENSNHSKIANS